MAFVMVFLDGDAMAEALVESGLGAPGFGEGGGSDDLARAAVGDAEDDGAAAFVGERDAVVNECFEMEVLARALEFKARALWFGQPSQELFAGGVHVACESGVYDVCSRGVLIR